MQWKSYWIPGKKKLCTILPLKLIADSKFVFDRLPLQAPFVIRFDPIRPQKNGFTHDIEKLFLTEMQAVGHFFPHDTLL